MGQIKTSTIESFRKLFKDGWSFLETSEKQRIILSLVLTVFITIYETVALTGVMPLVALIVDPSLLQRNEILNKIHSFFGKPELFQFLIYLAFIAFTLLVVGTAAQLGIHLYNRRLGVRVQNRFSSYLLSKFIDAPYEWHLRHNPSKLAHLLHTDVLMWSNDFIQRIIAIPGYIAVYFVSFLILVKLSPLVSLLGCFLIGIIAFLFIKTLKSKLDIIAVERRNTASRMHLAANQILNAIKEIKLSLDRRSFVNLFVENFSKYGYSMVNFKFLQRIPSVSMFLIGQLALIIVALFYWKSGVIGGELTAKMTLLVIIVSRLIPNSTSIANELTSLSNVIPHVNGIREFIDEIEKINFNPGYKNKEFPKSWKNFKLEKICFSYNNCGQNVLKDITMSFEKGKSYGIVGLSGAGKTTLLNLLLNLFQPTSGSIIIDDIEIEDISVKEWSSGVGFVPQVPFFLDRTVKENIALGYKTSEIDEAKIKSCLKESNVLEEIMQRENGIKTLMGDKGTTFSIGQLQRLAIARALYSSPQILILDEATSSLDAISERKVKDAINSLKGDRTPIIVTHRLSTLSECDKIFFLSDGQIVGSGTYFELIDSNREFKQMVDNFTIEERSNEKV